MDNNPYSLRNYLYNLYLPALRRDIHIILSNRYLPEENIQFLAEFYTCAFLYYHIRKCDQPLSEREVLDAAEAAKEKFSGLIRACLRRM